MFLEQAELDGFWVIGINNEDRFQIEIWVANSRGGEAEGPEGKRNKNSLCVVTTEHSIMLHSVCMCVCLLKHNQSGWLRNTLAHYRGRRHSPVNSVKTKILIKTWIRPRSTGNTWMIINIHQIDLQKNDSSIPKEDFYLCLGQKEHYKNANVNNANLNNYPQ